MNNSIEITLKDVYGAIKAYPHNDQARRLADMVNTKTLTLQTLLQAKAMGFNLVYVDRFGACEDWSGEALRIRLS